MNELHLYSENYQIDVDSMLSLDEDICLVNNTSAVYSNTGSAMQPFPTGIIQISPNGTNDEMVRSNECQLYVAKNSMNIQH